MSDSQHSRLRVRLERRGGLHAPAMRRSCVVDTGDCLPEAEQELRGLVLRAGLRELGERKASAAPDSAAQPLPDAFTYLVTIEDAGLEQTVAVGPRDMSDAIGQLIRWIEQRAS